MGIVTMGAGAGVMALTPDLVVGIAGASVAGLGYGLAATHLTPLVINTSPQSQWVPIDNDRADDQVET